MDETFQEIPGRWEEDGSMLIHETVIWIHIPKHLTQEAAEEGKPNLPRVCPLKAPSSEQAVKQLRQRGTVRC